MTATIIPFRARGSDHAGLPPGPAGVADYLPAAPPIREDRADLGTPAARTGPVRLPGPASAVTTRTYTGPCRRLRGVRGAAVAASVRPPAAPAPAADPATQPDRLARALESLRSALSQQAVVVAAWRGSLAELDHAVGSLQRGVGRQSGALRALQAQAARPGSDAEPSRAG